MTEALVKSPESTAYRWRWLALVAVLAAEIMDLVDGTIVASRPRSTRTGRPARW